MKDIRPFAFLKATTRLVVLASAALICARVSPETGLDSAVFSIEHVEQPGLAALRTDLFTTISHPAFPRVSARIKKSDFCDGGVNAYSGYIDVGARHLFFYFFESRSDPDNDDVLLWTNGGPGGTSAMGLFMELGPCSIASKNSTKYNPNSWNTNANIFFVDQPAGTGFSYTDFDEKVTSTEEAAKDIASFVAVFFETFSKFKSRRFHLTGESYAGRFLPVFGSVIYDQNTYMLREGLAPINLKSIVIGNGATDFFELLWSYYDMQCTNATIPPFQTIRSCVRMKQALPHCKRWTQMACFDHFDLMDCNASFRSCAQEILYPYFELDRSQHDITLRCKEQEGEVCYPEESLMQGFLNQPWVRSKLGVSSSFRNFTPFDTSIQANFFATGDELHLNQLYVAELLERGVKVLIYAGDLDFIGNWVANERWTRKMEWPGKEEFSRKELQDWFVSDTAAGRFRTHGNFTFTTVFGAGHMVPHDKAIESLEMIQRWLADKSL